YSHYSILSPTTTSHTDIYTLSLHDALPISLSVAAFFGTIEFLIIAYDANWMRNFLFLLVGLVIIWCAIVFGIARFQITKYHGKRSEEHTSELQSRENLVCRLLLEKKKVQVK